MKLSYSENPIFFQFFIVRSCIFFKNLISILRICPFEIEIVDVAQKLWEWKGGQFSQIWHICPPTILIIFELNQQFASQKNIFLMWNWDFWKKYMVLLWKIWKNQIFLKAWFLIGVLCSKTLDRSDRIKKCTKIFKI